MKDKFLIQFAHMMVSFSGIGKELRKAKKEIKSLEKQIELHKQKFNSARELCRRAISMAKTLEKENGDLWILSGEQEKEADGS